MLTPKSHSAVFIGCRSELTAEALHLLQESDEVKAEGFPGAGLDRKTIGESPTVVLDDEPDLSGAVEEREEDEARVGVLLDI